MNYKQRNNLLILFISFMIVSAASCRKDNSASSSSGELTTSSDVIAVAALTSTGAANAKSGESTDSVYVIQHCAAGYHRDSVLFSSLPAGVASYLTTNYSGYTFANAYSIVSRTNVTAGYVVIITFNANPVALEFDAAGTFVRVLEQREAGDLDGKGWHTGGKFDNRDGRHRDTLALTALPALITSYFATNYAQDTLVAAFKSKAGSYLVLSKNNGAFATTFDSLANFVARVQLQTQRNRVTEILQSALPAAVTSYLTTTYPGFVFEKAFALKPSVTTTGYIVVIDANATKYALQFNASGGFVRSVTIK